MPPSRDDLYALGCTAWDEGDLSKAERLLEACLDADEKHADACHALGLLAEQRGDGPRAISYFLRTWSLDERSAHTRPLSTPPKRQTIERVAKRVLAELPEPFSRQVAHVPVILEDLPSRDLVETGFDPRTLGLFEGLSHGEVDLSAPARIVLYTHNLLASFPEEADLEEEVEVTLLHEIGHYFGLDEEDLERVGLD